MDTDTGPNDHCVRIVHHIYYICMVYPMWIWAWYFKLSLRGNCVPQVSHLCGFSHMDTDMSFQMSYLRELCTTGITFVWFSPVWIRTWDFKVPLCENCAPQVSHLYGLSPVWIRTWDLIVHHRYHICMVHLLYGYGHGTSSYC